jgi:RNA polymerase sigma-70 factor, ECF subfamily
VYENLRPLLFSIAYGIVGSVSEAEDIVQEAFLRFHREQGEEAEINSPRAWLSTVTTRLAINQVRSARARRETYVGTWLPEPLLTDPAPDASQHAEMADSLSMALLVLLETLSPVERAVFLLREVFDYGYDEIAAIVGKSEANCRQIALRARRQVEARKPRFEASRRRREELARRFLEAVGEGDTEGLIGLLAADVVAYADGGGKTRTFTRPVYGRERIARLLPGFGTWLELLGAQEMRFAEVNGQPGALSLS